MREIEVEFRGKNYLPKQSNKMDKELNLIDAEDKLLREGIEEYFYMADR